MPAKSRQQFKFFKAIENDPRLQKEHGVSKETAQDYTKDMTKDKFKRLKERVGKKK